MSFFEAVRTCLFRKYFQFQGRASRAEYWWFALFTLLAWVALRLSGSLRLLVVAGVAVLVIGTPQLAVTIRRLHDTDRSGWWVLLGPAGSMIGFVMGVRDLVGSMTHLVLLWFLAQRGDRSGNRFGSNPAPDATLDLGRLGFRPPPTRD